ncbi:sulfatase-like hydrolase/transferase [Shewanella sp. D64]|uniref:sulfatase family protein n=1 Tax=unclassified Shewanella TaxID=196818 RepID=UPI002DD6758D|nr:MULTISPECIES: sulfatase-like hydrolase/transferase [unclassified Shewanella]MEC4726465.1 sulfatase-like hydrolase/transferase [Shewanella sp. D64]MEC4738477.1 sulfatase-like hydrolase/transferase [Shewanella sp. E94]
MTESFNNTVLCFFVRLVSAFSSWSAYAENSQRVNVNRPNIILIMADDLGYGDTGFTGNNIIKTPSLDQMAKEGVVMTNFHSGGSVCSPTRGTFLTGRHHYRYGIFWANIGRLPKEEITLSEILQQKGYMTGHFGKWHLGTLSKDFSAKGKKRKPLENFSPPTLHGYDSSFVTESAVALWDPSKGKIAVNTPFGLDGVALEPADVSLKGGASKVVMDRVLPFIEKAVKKGQVFFTVIWFHAPHMDVVAGPEYLAQYKGHGEAAHYYGVVTEMDQQIGRLRDELKRLGIDKNTLITFTSDNGPEGEKANGRSAGVTDGLKGRKRDLYEGGVRVPTFALWPGNIKAGSTINTASSTLDYLPTINEIVDYQMPDNRPIDGASILSLLVGGNANSHSTQSEQQVLKRTKAIPSIRDKLSLIEGNYKLVTSFNHIEKPTLYNLKLDRSETTDIAMKHPQIVKAMTRKIKIFIASAKASHRGEDYPNENFKVVDSWPQSFP